MGGFGSGRTPKVGRRSRQRQMTNELLRIRSFDMMNRSLEEQGLASKIPLKCQGITVAELLVSSDHLEVYRPGEIFPGKQILMSAMRREGCGVVKGYRFTFSCPSCQGRCIYLYWNGGSLGCKQCYDLMHPTQNMSKEDRWFWKKNKFLKRHNLTQCQVSSGKKPKGMHKKKFQKIQEEWVVLDHMAYLLLISRHNYPLALAALKAV